MGNSTPITRQDLETEVSKLKSELSPPAPDSAPDTAPAAEDAVPAGAAQNPHAAADENGDGPEDAGVTFEDVQRLLEEHGVEIGGLQDHWRQLSAELHDLPSKKPLVTALAAFAFGFLVGRLSSK